MRKDIEMMGTKEKVLALLAVLVVFGQVYAAEEAKDGPPLSDVRLSAYIVKVDLEALYESGVNPVGKKPDTVSILKILSCFAQEKAEVIGGSSLYLNSGRRSLTNMKTQKYRKESINVY